MVFLIYYVLFLTFKKIIMDKKTLFLGTFLFLPGILMLMTLFSPEFNSMSNLYWFTTFTSRLCFSLFCNSLAVTSLLLLIFKKDLPMDKLYDIRVEKRKVSGTNAILKFLSDNKIEGYSEEYVRKFVDENYDEVVNNIKK